MNKIVKEYLEVELKKIKDDAQLPATSPLNNMQECLDDYVGHCEDFFKGLMDTLPEDSSKTALVMITCCLSLLKDSILATNDEYLLEEFIPEIDPCDLEKERK